MGITPGRLGCVYCLRACLGRVLACHDRTPFKMGRVAQPYPQGSEGVSALEESR